MTDGQEDCYGGLKEPRIVMARVSIQMQANQDKIKSASVQKITSVCIDGCDVTALKATTKCRCDPAQRRLHKHPIRVQRSVSCGTRMTKSPIRAIQHQDGTPPPQDRIERSIAVGSAEVCKAAGDTVRWGLLAKICVPSTWKKLKGAVCLTAETQRWAEIP